MQYDIPKSAMVIVAHPDDAEFTVAGTIAKWVQAGCQVTYVVCTDGNAGSHDSRHTKESLALIRRAEQKAACDTIGVQNLVFLGHDDGQLVPSLELRRELVREIRTHKPEVVITWDPTRLFGGDYYINHPDHRAASQATLDAVAPASAMPLLWPDVGSPHQVQKVLISGPDEPNTWVDISETIDLKVAALRKHASQMGDRDPTDRIKGWAAENGKTKGMAFAECYRVITLVRPG